MTGVWLQIPIWILIAWMYFRLRRLRARGRRSPINEEILRLPGHSVRLQQSDVAYDAMLYMAGVIGIPFVIYSFKTQSDWLNLSLVVVGIAGVAFCLVQFARLFNRAVNLHLAVEAETLTGQELNRLMRDAAWVFHDIPYQYGNIDHVVVSTGGVFAVETKGVSKPTKNENGPSENSTVRVNGEQLIFPHIRTGKPIAQAEIHAKWLRNEIGRRFSFAPLVKPVVALPGWMVKGGFNGHCWVVNPKRGNSLRRAVRKQVISENEVQLIAMWVEDLSRSVKPKSKQFDKKTMS